MMVRQVERALLFYECGLERQVPAGRRSAVLDAALDLLWLQADPASLRNVLSHLKAHASGIKTSAARPSVVVLIPAPAATLAGVVYVRVVARVVLVFVVPIPFEAAAAPEPGRKNVAILSNDPAQLGGLPFRRTIIDPCSLLLELKLDAVDRGRPREDAPETHLAPYRHSSLDAVRVGGALVDPPADQTHLLIAEPGRPVVGHARPRRPLDAPDDLARVREPRQHREPPRMMFS